MVIHELQAESWGPDGKQVKDISVEEGNKSLDAERLKGRVKFGQGTGMHEMYLWGSEYWYFRMVKQHDPSLWNAAKNIFREYPYGGPYKICDGLVTLSTPPDPKAIVHCPNISPHS
jgi:hypothetical protein